MSVIPLVSTPSHLYFYEAVQWYHTVHTQVMQYLSDAERGQLEQLLIENTAAGKEGPSVNMGKSPLQVTMAIIIIIVIPLRLGSMNVNFQKTIAI